MKRLSKEQKSNLDKKAQKMKSHFDATLKEHKLGDLEVKSFRLGPKDDNLVCPKGYHKELFCNNAGLCVYHCVKDIQNS
jgi:hypothetical protein